MQILLTFIGLLISFNAYSQTKEDQKTNEYVLNIDTTRNNYNRGRIKDLSFFIKMSPDNYKNYLERGYLYLLLRKYDEALNDIELAYKLNSNAQGLNYLKMKLLAIKNVLIWVKGNLKPNDKLEPIQFDEFFVQNYFEQIQKILETKSQVKYSIVFSYSVNDSLIKGEYFHLDSNLNIAGKMTFPEMIKLSLSSLPINFENDIKETDKERLIRSTEDIKKEPSKWINYQIRAGAKESLGDTLGAISDYERAIELIPKEEEFYYEDLPLLFTNFGILKFEVGEIDASFDLIDKAISYNPKYAYAYLFRGRVKCKVGKIDSGCKDIKKAIELDSYMIEDGRITEKEMNDCEIKK